MSTRKVFFFVITNCIRVQLFTQYVGMNDDLLFSVMKDSLIMTSRVITQMPQQSLNIRPEVVGSILGGCKISKGVQKVKEKRPQCMITFPVGGRLL